MSFIDEIETQRDENAFELERRNDRLVARLAPVDMIVTLVAPVTGPFETGRAEMARGKSEDKA